MCTVGSGASRQCVCVVCGGVAMFVIPDSEIVGNGTNDLTWDSLMCPHSHCVCVCVRNEAVIGGYVVCSVC